MRIGAHRIALALLALVDLAGTARAADRPAEAAPGDLGLARPTQFVTDETGRLPEHDRRALNERLAAFERETSNQVLFYVAQRQPAGLKAETAALRALDEWRVGQAGVSNGVVLLLFVGDRTMGLAVGAGLDAAIPRALRQRILDEALRPQLRAGSLAGGLNAAAARILPAARQAGYRGKGRTAAEAGAQPPVRAPRRPAAPAPQPPPLLYSFGPGTAALLLLGLAAVAATGWLSPSPGPGLVCLVLAGLANTGFLVYSSLSARAASDLIERVAGSLAGFVGLIALSVYRRQSRASGAGSSESVSDSTWDEDAWRRSSSSDSYSSSTYPSDSSSSSEFSGGGGSGSNGSGTGGSW
jgi:uncharacterized membrane protein YgcG